MKLAGRHVAFDKHIELRLDIFYLDNACCEPRSIAAGSTQMHKFIRVAPG